jgi:hypothetical protein
VSASTDPTAARTSRTIAGRSAALVAIGLAVTASAWLAAWPCSYRGTTSTPTGSTTTCSSLIAVNGVWIVAYLAFPILVTAGAYVALVAGRRAVVSTLAILLLVLCVLSALSIGVFYIPSALALLVATARMDRSGAGGATSRS